MHCWDKAKASAKQNMPNAFDKLHMQFISIPYGIEQRNGETVGGGGGYSCPYPY